MPEYRQKTFRYMTAKFLPDQHETLQAEVTNALHRHRTALQRQEQVDLAGETLRLINSHRVHRGCLCGVLCSYSPGVNQLAVSLDPNARELPIQQVAPPPAAGARRSEFLEGLLFFAVRENRVVLVGEAAMRSVHFEQHVNWLLANGQDNAAGRQVLVADPETEIRRNARVQEVKAVSFSSGIQMEQAAAVEHQQVSFRPRGAMWTALIGVLEAAGIEMPPIDFDPSLRPEDLRVRIQVVNTRRRDAIEGGTPVLDPLANAFRHAEGADFKIEFRDHTTLSGDQLRVTAPMKVVCHNGIPEVAALYQQMTDWLESLMQRADID